MQHDSSFHNKQTTDEIFGDDQIFKKSLPNTLHSHCTDFNHYYSSLCPETWHERRGSMEIVGFIIYVN